MPDTPVSFSMIGKVASIRLNRPDQGNTLTLDLLECLSTHLLTVSSDPDIRALVLSGEGPDFSLGGDFNDFADALSQDERHCRMHCKIRTGALARVIAGLQDLQMPTIAAVNGQAAGAGFSLALACDMRLIDPRTRFNFAYGALGASPDGGMTWLLPRIVGRGQALRWLLDQPILRAKVAVEAGLAHEIVPAAELLDHAISLASLFAADAAHPHAAVKCLLRGAEARDLREHMEFEHAFFAEGLMSDDMKAALDARTRGDVPVFK